MPTGTIAHTLRVQEQLSAIAKRMKRAHGQMGAVIRMLEDNRSCEEIVTRMAAVGESIKTAAFTLISPSLKECIEEANVDRDAMTERLQKLFLSLA